MHRTPSALSLLARVCAASLVGLAVCAPAGASHVGDTLTTDQQVVTSNDTLVRTLQQWETTPAAQRSQRTTQLTQIAVQRRERMLALLERNPSVAAARFLPGALRDRLPAAVQGYVERPAKAAGTVHATVSDDFARGRSKTEFFLHLNDTAQQRLKLHLADTLGSERDLMGFVGRKVSVDGTQLDGHLVVTDKRSMVVALDGTTTATPTTVGTTAIVKGDQKTLSILVNFSDAALSCTAADVSNRLFGSTGATVNANYRASSRDQVSFSGTAVGPFTIPYSASGTCDYSAWGAAAEAAARAAGVDPSQYARVNYVHPSNGSCGWSGLAYMPGRQSWVAACTATGVFSHELGHNLSLHHAATPTAEYGDGSDPMGGARVVMHNGANRVMAGWMATGTVADVTVGGSYAVDALGLATSTSPQVLRVYKPDTKEWYHVSLRQAIGLDAGLSASYQNAVSITRAAGTLPTRTYLMAALPVGQSWTDTTNGISIAHLALAGNTSTLSISLSGATCTRAAPTVALSPTSQSSQPGQSRSFTVSVRNNDSAACPAGSIALAQALPAGFTGSVAASLSVSPGATATTTWSVTPAATTAAGSYGLDLRATDASGNASTAHATYAVTVDTDLPVVALTSPAPGSSVTGRSVTLAATASDATSAIARVEFWVDGKLLATDTAAPYSASWNLRKATKGAHTVVVRGVDAAGNVGEASATLTVY